LEDIRINIRILYGFRANLKYGVHTGSTQLSTTISIDVTIYNIFLEQTNNGINHGAATVNQVYLVLRLLLASSRYDIIDTQDEAGTLDSGLEGLCLDAVGLPDVELVHVGSLTGGTIDTPAGSVGL
jgi:hypothetical protein